MQFFNDSTSGKPRTTSAFGARTAVAGWVLCSLLMLLFGTTALYAQAPNAPTNLAATAASSSQIDLTWTDNSSNEDGFIIQRSATSGSGFSDIDTVAGNMTSFSDTGLNGNTPYYYKVAAYNGTGRSDSNEANATTNPNAPSTPTDLTATATSSSQIDLSWTDASSTNNATARFRIERKTGSSGTYTQIDSVNAPTTTYSNAGLSEGTQYYYRVRAVNVTGHSAYSNETNATTKLNTPTGLTATTVSNTRIDLAWTDNSGIEDGFKIEFSTVGNTGPFTEIATVGANVQTYSSLGLNPNTEYFYRVRAYKATNYSDYSNVSSATTLPDIPAAPSGLTATAVSNTQINLSWTDNSSNESGFKIERKLTSGITFTQIATVSANVTSYSSTGLSASTSYTYRVRAFNTGGNSGYSNQASATTLINPPAAPSSLTATAVSNSQINLTWTDNATTETGFKIERKIGASGMYAQIDSVDANVTTYSNTGLTGNTEYYYRVRAKNAGGNSAYSNEANATTLQDPPAAPSGLTATAISNSQIDLAWTDNSDNENGFKIEIKVGASGTYTQLATTSANVVTYSSTGLEAGTEYFYRVLAFNGTGNSAFSNEANATTLPEPPEAPGNLTATAVSQTQINLTWTDHANNEAGFRIERKLSSAATYTEFDTVGANVTSYASTGLTANTAYTYRVRAFNVTGNSAYSDEIDATTLPNPPAAPSGLIATTVSNSQIDLSWTDNAATETGFKIERKAAGETAYTEIATVAANTTNYSSTGLAGSTQYFYRVRAFNTGGNSAYSNEANATTLQDPPPAPSGLTATTVSNTQINLTWTDNSTNETGFKIERKAGASSTYAQIDTVAANVTAYSSTGLSGGTGYFYRVRAFNAGGNSAYSNEANATTHPDAPAAPNNLTATVVSNTEINLAWTDNSDYEDGFTIEIKIAGEPTFTEIDSVSANVTSYLSGGLNPNTPYVYRVRAFNITGNSAYSNEANATTAPEPPLAPSGLTATAISNTQIDLAWTDNSSNESSFLIEYKLSSAATFTQLASVGANVTSYSSTGLSGNTAYNYRVRASNATGVSSYSNTASATTLVDPPNAPGSLTATTVSTTQINLAWTDNSSNEDGFKIERKAAGDIAYTQIAAVGANVTSYSSTGLTGNTQYFYRVRSHRSGSHSAYSNEANATTYPNAPTAPSGLTATAVSTSQIDLAWTDNSNNESSFRIERKAAGETAYTEIDTVAANALSYSNTGLSAGTQYFYRVRARNLGGNSAYSNEASATTVPNPPAEPINLTATAVSNTQINLAWEDNASNETGFKIERKTGSGSTYMQIDSVAANVTSYSNTGLSGSTEYYYQVRAYNAGGNSSYSNEANATTLPDPPVAPSNLTATAASNSQINLEWTDNSGDENGFKIEIKTAADSAYTQIATVGANNTTYASAGLNPNTQYFYRVRAFNANGHSAYSNVANATTLPDLPLAPSDLTATAVGSNKINLAWTDNSNNESGFKIERKLSTAVTFNQIATVGANVTSYQSTGLTPNTIYVFRVRAFNTTGNSAYSNTASDTSLVSPPAAPSALTATAISSNQINLAWTDNASNEDGFNVERKAASDTAYTEIASLGVNVTSYSSTGLTANTLYSYRVRSFRNSGSLKSYSAYSNVASGTTLPEVPAAPSALTATTVSSSQINLGWTDNSNNETGFKIERKIGAAGEYAQIDTVAANVTTYASTGLSGSTQYFYRVRASNANGHSAYSNEASATTLASTPNPPSNLVATAISKSQINLTWTDNSSNETVFRIERKVDVGGTYAQIDSVGANVTSYSNTGLFGNTPYYYRVRARNANGNSAYSNEANALTLMNGPSNLTATAVSSSQINLSWTDNSGSEIGYKIERSAASGGPFTQIDTAAANATSYSNTGLAASTQYFYRVRAYNSNNVSGYSNEANATTLDPTPTPAAPSGLTATAVSKTQIDLAWTDNASNETGFLIERKTGSGGTYSQIASVGANVTSFNSTGLNTNTQYFYRVRATNGSGNSAYSNEANALTFMNGPSNLAATAISSSQINLSWTDNTSSETGFKIERKTGASGTYAEIATAAQNATSFSDASGLTASTEYFYRIRAFNASNVSGYSNEASATTFSAGGLPAPTNLTATAVSISQINLTWADNSSTENGFKIERKQGASGTYSQIATVGANVTTFANTGLLLNTTYFYRVRAFDATTNSSYSGEASATTFIKAPSNLVATTISSSQINLSWTDNSNTETGFKIERKIGASGTYAEIATVSANVTAFSNTGLTVNTTYFYRVRAVSSTTVSAYSNEASATTSVTKENELSLDAAPPTDIVLAPNYPNPFNPSTTISFRLPEGMNVSLKVVNVTGQEVATLVDGYRAAGTHRATFKATKLPSGIYYAVLKAGEVTQIQRMMLAK
ncbi:MAG: fibronectin type III domain-containing protein [candidate division KSB1 bacterium]|nr:fibronectin type III domain-containing protein [candidate division KSB1 bacterium]MDZ7369322.1 fibronectin type III domain-containing protein [candidate division KSB1 bacterium]MDZ7407332.1 fibronectin type III domain-containing protein [candidate division KSB1 bacterium]